jgi:hypothetical protein
MAEKTLQTTGVEVSVAHLDKGGEFPYEVWGFRE